MRLSTLRARDGYKTVVAACLLMLSATAAFAQETTNTQVTKAQDKPTRHSIAMEGALTSDETWNLELSYRYKFLSFLSAGAGIGMWKQFAYDGLPSGNGWCIDDDDEKISNFYVRPNVMLTTPKLFGIRNMEFSLFANPGCMMNIPYSRATVDIITYEGNAGHVTDYHDVSSHKGDWAAFDLRTGIRFGSDDVHILIGYQFSTLDIYGLNRNMEFDHQRFDEFYPKKKPQHAAFIEITGDF